MQGALLLAQVRPSGVLPCWCLGLCWTFKLKSCGLSPQPCCCMFLGRRLLSDSLLSRLRPWLHLSSSLYCIS
ncbi:hypothetical protein ASPTUDRAFT_895006 [Aspergillus tubingensis CBS 134.48]|uniref:Uncharacterized protein n=1 Tax=Aspergillus tubingensis (strain CBS 134.48) TaxID=767770 RepID=A0A1L9MRR6_ASPTC|nr:hypothetical protein ASPTUDRAFT_895006 [Aspergillus tubingensis CBS 134.48]